MNFVIRLLIGVVLIAVFTVVGLCLYFGSGVP
jgi:hypothetical protein